MTEAAAREEELETTPGDLRPVAVDEAAVIEEATAAETGFATFKSLHYRDYRLLWTGTILGSAGQWIQQVTVGWLVWELTRSGFLLGAINGFRSLPLLLLGPFGGVAADRVERKRLLLFSNLLLLVATAAMAAVILAGQLEVWHLFAFSLVTGIAWAFNNPVRQSIVPNLVPRADLMNALALNAAGFNSMRVLGPSVGGVLVAKLGGGENFLLQSLAYLGVTAMVLQMVVPEITRADEVSIRENLTDGAKYVWQHPVLRLQMALALVPMVVGMPYMTLMPIFAQDVLHRGATGYGLLVGAVGVGAVIGTLGLASLGSLQNKGRVLLGAVFTLGAAIILFSFSRSFALSLSILVMSGIAQMIYMTTNQTMLQLAIPDALRGRVMGIYMLNQGLLPLGSLFAGAMADAFSAPTSAFVMGSLVCLFAIAFIVKAETIRAA